MRNVLFSCNVAFLFYICSENELLKLYGLYLFSTILYLVTDLYIMSGIPDKECEFTIIFLLFMVFPFVLTFSFTEQTFITTFIFFQWLYQYKTMTRRIDENLLIGRYGSVIFNNLDITITKGKEICSICLEHNDEKYVELPCKHQFHQHCFFYYVNKRQKMNEIPCPICRRDLLENETCFLLY